MKTEISLLFVTCCYKLKADIPGVCQKGSHKTPFAGTRRYLKLKADLSGVGRFSLKRPDQPAPLKKKFTSFIVFVWWLSKSWTVCSCVKYLQGFPLKKNNVKYLQEFPFKTVTCVGLDASAKSNPFKKSIREIPLESGLTKLTYNPA